MGIVSANCGAGWGKVSVIFHKKRLLFPKKGPKREKGTRPVLAFLPPAWYLAVRQQRNGGAHMELCRIEEIRLLLARHGFPFPGGLGQNFLCDPDIPREIAPPGRHHAGGMRSGGGARHRGPQRPAVPQRKQVAAVELGRAAAAILAETMADCPNFTLIPGTSSRPT